MDDSRAISQYIATRRCPLQCSGLVLIFNFLNCRYYVTRKTISNNHSWTNIVS